jgi:Dolichyl-phosphate-mannose-protein mannosyltransferase
MRGRVFEIGLAAAVVLGLLVRLAVIVSPLGEIDGDEAIVGLMARHIAFVGERPVFYWGQPYLGSLEAFTTAPLFALFNSSTPLLKLVPTAYSLGFLALSAILARRLFGPAAGLATAAYLALPPAMWAVWSTKARGGYAEVLFLGEALLLATLALAQSPNSRKLALLWGLLAGLAFWTHLLAIVYIAPAVLYLAVSRARQAIGRPAMVPLQILVGLLIGMLPLLIDNVSGGFLTLKALFQPADVPIDAVAQWLRFFRVGVPVLLGLAQPTTSEALFDADWLQRPAAHLWLVALVLVALTIVVATHAGSVRRLIACGANAHAEPALLVLLVLVVPLVVALTRFGFFVSEPRYAMPLYSAVPLLFGAIASWPRLLTLTAVVALAFNSYSLLSTDVRLWRPEDAPDSTAATRTELVAFLVAQDRHQMYTDYWIGYPIMFETRETVLPYVISGGFNRYVPPADNVQRTPNPAWVFTPGTDAEQLFVDALAARGGQATFTAVAAYHVYTNVEPLEAMRPSR